MSNKTQGMDQRFYSYYQSIGFREPDILAKLREETQEKVSYAAGMQICPEQGQLMGLLVKATGASQLLEVGTFTGYSSLACALALPPDGHMVCCDVDEEFTNIARRYWKEAGVMDKMTLHLGPAVQSLEAMLNNGDANRFDMMFIDANKADYDAYYERGLQLIRPGGLILIDNVFWDGRVADPGNTEKDTVTIRTLNEKIHIDPRVQLSMLPIGDGLTIAMKL